MIWLFLIPVFIFIIIVLLIATIKEWNKKSRNDEIIGQYNDHYLKDDDSKKNRK